MPIYEYECKACGDVAEVMQKMSDPPPASCPVCAQGPMVKMMSRTAFILKGEGWYVTDFRDKKKPAAKADTAPAADAAAPAAPAVDAKPAEPKTEAPATKPAEKSPAS